MKWFIKVLNFQAVFICFRYPSFFQTGFNVIVNALFIH